MSKSSEAVKRWRATTKQTLVAALGGKCVICGYNKCNDALDLHHLDPSKKALSFTRIIGHPTKWETIVKEAKKCVLLCANHHREYHAGFLELPSNVPAFDQRYEHGKIILQSVEQTACPICGALKPASYTTCSKACAARKARKVDWDSIDLPKLLREETRFCKIGELLGVSGTAVKKRATKLNLIPG